MIALYVRTSIDFPDAAAQLRELEEAAQDLGLTPGATYVDTADRRPSLAQLLRDVRAGDHAILITRFSRIARSVRHLGELLEQLGEARLIALAEGFDSHTRRGRIGAQHLIHLARFDREVASETTRTSHARARAKGVRLGRPPTVTP